MSEEVLTLAELMFHAEQFCLRVDAVVRQSASKDEDCEELRLKLGQCRNLLAELQHAFDADELRIANPSVRGNFRALVMALLWVAYRARHAIDRRTFRMLVMVESGFTYLLSKHR